jgi:hypothetical protein
LVTAEEYARVAPSMAGAHRAVLAMPPCRPLRAARVARFVSLFWGKGGRGGLVPVVACWHVSGPWLFWLSGVGVVLCLIGCW